MSNNTSRESFLKGALILSLAGVIVKIMGAFFRIPLSNLIGSIGMGYYQVVYPIYTLFLIKLLEFLIQYYLLLD